MCAGGGAGPSLALPPPVPPAARGRVSHPTPQPTQGSPCPAHHRRGGLAPHCPAPRCRPAPHPPAPHPPPPTPGRLVQVCWCWCATPWMRWRGCSGTWSARPVAQTAAWPPPASPLGCKRTCAVGRGGAGRGDPRGTHTSRTHCTQQTTCCAQHTPHTRVHIHAHTCDCGGDGGGGGCGKAGGKTTGKASSFPEGGWVGSPLGTRCVAVAT
jgi:hypothetical protein